VCPGQYVKIKNLEKSKELNGEQGIVFAWDADSERSLQPPPRHPLLQNTALGCSAPLAWRIKSHHGAGVWSASSTARSGSSG
jgi:hypothetical protein